MIKKFLLTTITTLGLLSIVAVPSAGAIDVISTGCSSAGTANSAVCQQKSGPAAESFITKGINLLLYALGIVTVIVIIVGGFKYTTSNGDSSKVKSAKDTIMYGVIGLAVAILSFVIVNIVLSYIK